MKAYQQNVWNVKKQLEDYLALIRKDYTKELMNKSPDKDRVIRITESKEAVTNQIHSLVDVYNNHHEVIDMLINNVIDSIDNNINNRNEYAGT